MSTQIIRPPAFQRPSGYLGLSGIQYDIPNETYTVVELDQIPSDFNDGIENSVNHRITPGVAGFYAISAIIAFFDLVADKRYEASIELNGSTSIQATCSQASITGNEQLSCPISIPCYYLSATDYLELVAWHRAGVDTININPSFTFLAVQRVR